MPLYQALGEAGWDIRLYSAETYLSQRMIGTADNVIRAPLTVGSTPKLFAKMMQFVGFRYLPHLLKPACVFTAATLGSIRPRIISISPISRITSCSGRGWRPTA